MLGTLPLLRQICVLLCLFVFIVISVGWIFLDTPHPNAEAACYLALDASRSLVIVVIFIPSEKIKLVL